MVGNEKGLGERELTHVAGLGQAYLARLPSSPRLISQHALKSYAGA